MNAVNKSEQTALTLPERASVALGSPAHEVKLRELVQASAAIVAVTNKAGRDECHTAYMTLKNTRVNINHTVEDVTEDAKAFTKAVKTEATRLLMITLAEEERLQNLRDAWDDAEQARKDALIAAERTRCEAIQARITAVRNLPASTVGKSAVEISQMIYELAGTISEDDAHAATFEEFADEFKATRANVLDALAHVETEQLAIEAAAREAEQERLREAARLEAEKLALAAQRAENERIANEQAVERQRLAALAEAQEKAAAKLREEAAANLKAEQEAQAKVAAETKRQLEAQQAAIAEQTRKLAEQQAAADARDAAALAAQQDAARREDDHGPALLMNAEFDATREAERVRLQDLSDQHLVDSMVSDRMAEIESMPPSDWLITGDGTATMIGEADSHVPTSDLEALMGSTSPLEYRITTDREIIQIVADYLDVDYGMAISRMQSIDFHAARVAA